MISTLAALLMLSLASEPASPAPAPPPMPGSPAGTAPAEARANLGRLIGNGDYPAEALRKREQGVVEFRLQVGVDGRVTNCSIIRSSGFASLDSTTCRLLTERARFSPARDSSGKPVEDSVSARIVWRLAGAGPRRFAAGSLVERIAATMTGLVTCTHAVDGRPPRAVQCPREAAAALLHIVRMERAAPEQTIVTTFTPEGEAEPTVRGKYGATFMDSEAALAVAADGSVLECRVVRHKALGLARGKTLPSPCEDYAPGSLLFERAAEAAPPRRMTVRVRGYYRG